MCKSPCTAVSQSPASRFKGLWQHIDVTRCQSDFSVRRGFCVAGWLASQPRSRANVQSRMNGGRRLSSSLIPAKCSFPAVWPRKRNDDSMPRVSGVIETWVVLDRWRGRVARLAFVAASGFPQRRLCFIDRRLHNGLHVVGQVLRPLLLVTALRLLRAD